MPAAIVDDPMARMTQLLSKIWKHRSSLLLLGRIAAEAWKTAKEVTREYIRFLIRKKLKRQIAIITLEIGLLGLAHAGVRSYPGLAARLFASAALWAVTLYNLFDLLWFTIPELREVYRTLRGRVGYTLRYFLQISVATELLEWNILLLGVCFFLAFGSRTYLAASFDYIAPWREGLDLLLGNL
ncbi:MAG: hypothetical protein KDD51_05705 [Bdellovibrionales bacterium]|nr:hypothetical protein [Bdellovibrionales bacterium]